MRIFLVGILLFSNLFGLDRAMKKVMATESKIALVVGNSEYKRSENFGNLDNPVNDVKAVSKKLKSLGFKVIEGYNLSALQLDDRVMEFTSLLRAKKDGVDPNC